MTIGSDDAADRALVVTPESVQALPLDARAAAYLDAQERLQDRLALPGA